ncbi:MAG: TonB-dependent receptor [Saprospiraceae bacterium]|nr:TonB-dependent receptor [Saprospiraceae bacterium]MDW8229743.1 TonB-dependent receptor [Saprospiraceae bacterium]
MRIRVLSFLRVCLAWALPLGLACAQTEVAERRVSARCFNCEVQTVIQDIAVRHHVNISYQPNFFSACPRITVDIQEEALKSVLERLTECARVKVEWHDDQVVIRALREYVVSGRVLDVESGEWLIGATVRWSGSNGVGGSTTTNEYGFFSFKAYEGRLRMSAHYVGHRPQSATLEVQADRFFAFRLVPDATLPEITIRNVPAIVPGSAVLLESGRRISPDDMRQAPMLGGEADPMRYAALLPGVVAGVDGLGGLHVRGGNADQNLFLLDDVPVYNPSHALGIISIFPSAAIHHAQLWKGDFPARYGGRASSVLDVRLRDGNPHRYGGEVSVGLLAASLSFEGPFLRKLRRSERSSEGASMPKNAFLVSVRRTPLELWQGLFRSQYRGALFLAGDAARYRFYDLTIKANYQFSERDQVHFSLYSGGDLFRNQFLQTFSSATALLNERYALGAIWGNNIVALRWSRTLRSGIFAKTILRYSRFYYQSQQDLLSESFSLASAKRKVLANYAQRYQTFIEDASLQTDWEFKPLNALTIHAGGSYAFHTFEPGALTVNFLLPGQSPLLADSLTKALFNRERVKADESSLYADAAWEFSRNGRLEAGLHVSSFKIRNRVFRLFQPRLRVSQRLLKHGQVWAGYHRMGQFLHQVGTFNLSFPFELWVPTTPRVLPEETWQYTAGLGFVGDGWSVSAEGYYRRLSRVLALKASTTALLIAGAEDASGWEDRIIAGSGWARGVELSVEKRFRHTALSATYTWSQAIRQFPDLNAGQPFPFRFDRPHVLNLSAQQRLARWLDMRVLWVYASGNPITLTALKFQHQTHDDNAQVREVLIYGSVNNYRLPNYHRLDVSCRVHFQTRSLHHEILLGAYNVYNRPNPFFMYLDGASVSASGQVRAVQYTLLPILPEFRYSLRF